MQKVNDNIYVLVALIMVGTFFMIVSFLVLLMQHQKKLLRQKQKLYETEIAYQKKVLDTVIQSQDEERARIGRNLHDDVGSALATMVLYIDRFHPENLSPQTFRTFQTDLRTLTRNISATVRTIAHNLVPPTLELYGLTEALAELTETTSMAQKIAVELQIETSYDLSQLSAGQALAIYRVIEELITNTIKHAHASAVVISITSNDNQLMIDYHDNGRGFASDRPVKKGMGMQNIAVRLAMIQAAYKEEGLCGYHLRIQLPLTLS